MRPAGPVHRPARPWTSSASSTGSPRPTKRISADALLLVAGGPALNAAITFAHLGGDATLVSSFGTGALARAAIAECRSHAVAVVDRVAGQSHDFPVSLVVSARQGATRCIVNSPVARSSAVGSVDLASAPPPDVVLLDQFEVDAAADVVPRLRETGVPIVLDGGSWKPVSQRFLDLATIPVVSSRFVPPGGDAMGFFERGPHAEWAVTQGAAGVTYGEDRRIRHIEASRVEAVDTSGAGDIFHGAFCFACASRRSFADALTFAASIAAASVRFAGPRGWMQADR